MAATNITTQKKKRSFGEWARSRDGQKVFVMIAFLDCTSGITDCVYLSSFWRDGRLQLL